MSNENAFVNATVVTLALNERFPERSYGTVPYAEQTEALADWLAFDQGVFNEAPRALAAYLDHQRHPDAG